MKRESEIEDKIEEALRSAGRITPVNVPVFFTERTLTKLMTSEDKTYSHYYPSLLKVAAIAVLVVFNAFTIQHIITNSNQDAVVINPATVKDLVNDYQQNDIYELTFENKIIHE